MAEISKFLAEEIATTWETMAEMEKDAPQGRRATLRECADVLRMLASRAPLTCPRAARLHGPLRYCPDCPEGDACELPRRALGGEP